jgi:hypothetical protein
VAISKQQNENQKSKEQPLDKQANKTRKHTESDMNHIKPQVTRDPIECSELQR